MEDRSLDEKHGRGGKLLLRDGLEVAHDARLGLLQGWVSAFDRLRKKIEGGLGSEDGVGHLLKAEQIHGLVVEFVHAAASVFRGRLADDGGGKLNRGGLPQTRQQQRHDDGCRVSDDDGHGLQPNLVSAAEFALHPGSAENDVGVVLQGVAEVDDFRAGIANGGPGFRDVGLVGGEEGKIHAFQMLRRYSLNDTRLVIDLLELTERILLVQKLDIDGGKAALAEDIANLLALEGGGSDEGDA